MTSDTTTIELEANGIRFVAYESGRGSGRPLALLLHGFPDDATTWKALMPGLAGAGYHVVAPYMRGYAPTSPSPTGHYQTAALGRDIVALIDALSPGRPAVVVGHDWGALGAYAAALKAPERIDKLVTAAVPYGARMMEAFTTNYRQQKRSWYIFFFQQVMAEMAVSHDGFRFLRNLWADWSPTWAFGEDDLSPVLETFAKPGVLEAALGYYRCLFDSTRLDPDLMEEQMRYGFAPIEVATLHLHGSDDGCMGAELLEGMEEAFPRGLTKVVVEGAGHFMNREKPDRVLAEILGFLSK
jgi:pimeloyl-ACP methyl ester carboxylesterase